MDDYGNGSVTEPQTYQLIQAAQVVARHCEIQFRDSGVEAFLVHVSADLHSGGIHMNEQESFSDSIYEKQTHMAERELSSFIAAVTKLYGPEQAKLSAKDWLDESELMDSPPRSEIRNWRAVTIAASARLANRVKDAARRIDN